jgi:hypothetical protein
MAAGYTTRYDSIPGLTAAADLSSSKQFKAVKLLSTAGTVNLVATSVLTEGVVGLLQNNPKSGDAAEVAVSGIAKGMAGTSTIVIGSLLTFNTTSNLIKTTTDNAKVVGQALTASAAIGDIISVLLFPGGLRY